MPIFRPFGIQKNDKITFSGGILEHSDIPKGKDGAGRIVMSLIFDCLYPLQLVLYQCLTFELFITCVTEL